MTVAFDYQASAATAARLIDRFGSQAPISRVVSSYSPTEGGSVVTSVDTTTAKVVSLPASNSLAQQFENKLIEQFKQGKIRFFYIAASGLGFAPEPLDLLLYYGKVWELAGVTELSPAGVPVYYVAAAKASALTQIPAA